MSYFNFLISKKDRRALKGFTVMELMVVTTISTIILAVIVFQQNKWADRLLLNSQVYELTLQIRQAQVYGLGVKEFTTGGGDTFNIGYGVHVEDSDLVRYIFFADRNKNKIYDSGEAIETKILTRGVVIDRFCDIDINTLVETCNGGSLRKLGVSFARPEAKANILFLNNGGNPTPGLGNNRAVIYLRSPGGKISSVKIENSGQVSIVQ